LKLEIQSQEAAQVNDSWRSVSSV